VARVLDWARVNGLRTGDNPAAFRGVFEHLWGALPPTTHMPSTGYEAVPELWQRLSRLETNASHALRFVLLTGVRSAVGLYARFNEIDGHARTWTVPEARRKTRRRAPGAFVVPLSGPALEIVAKMRERHPRAELIFPADTHGGKPHPRTLFNVLTARLGVKASVHGFRSAFRDFLGDRTNVERDIAELCLDHAVGGVEAAYRRATGIAKRRVALELWARHVCGEEAAATVIAFRAALQ
jgi:integrase